MNPIIDTLVIGFLILFMVFLINGYHKSKNYEEDDSYLSKQERDKLKNDE
jgi:large-conductance mechanosensitive channel